MKKSFVVFSLILIILLFSTINCFAYSGNDTVQDLFQACVDYLNTNNKPYYDYFIIKHKEGNYYYFYFSNTENGRFKVQVAESVLGDYDALYGNYYTIFYFNSEDKTEISPSATNSNGNSFVNCINLSNYEVIYGSTNLKRDDGTIFFQQTPLVMKTEMTLAGVLKENNPIQAWKVLMKNVVVSLVVFLVGLIAFSKAWAWLKTQLRKA